MSVTRDVVGIGLSVSNVKHNFPLEADVEVSCLVIFLVKADGPAVSVQIGAGFPQRKFSNLEWKVLRISQFCRACK